MLLLQGGDLIVNTADTPAAVSWELRLFRRLAPSACLVLSLMSAPFSCPSTTRPQHYLPHLMNKDTSLQRTLGLGLVANSAHSSLVFSWSQEAQAPVLPKLRGSHVQHRSDIPAAAQLPASHDPQSFSPTHGVCPVTKTFYTLHTFFPERSFHFQL